MKIKVKDNEANSRLDKFLVEKLKNKTRGEVQKIIKSQVVFVNKKVRDAHFNLSVDDLVELTLPKKETKKENLEIRKKIGRALKKKVEIICDEKDFVVLNKPAGLVVHGALHIKEFSLVDFLLEMYPEIKKIKNDKDQDLPDDIYRPGIVHRLDKDVSGLMVVAKTQKFYDFLKTQFQDRTVEKWYQVLVYFATDKDYDDINFLIKRSSAGNKQAAIPVGEKDNNEDAKEALSYFEVIKRLINYTLLKVRIKTGRKHQVRVHMHAYGHPVVGDPLYNTKKTRELNRRNNLGRVFLHATYLVFDDLSGERRKFESDLPADLKNFLLKVK